MLMRRSAERIAGSIGQSIDRNPNAFDGLGVLRVLEDKPSDEDKQKFTQLLEAGAVFKGERGTVMTRINPSISVSINLRSGHHSLSGNKLNEGMLYLARKYAGWKDPMGVKLARREKRQKK